MARSLNGRGGRPRLTDSPLANPETPIHVLAAKAQDYLHLPNPEPLYAVAGTLAANTIDGEPVWTILIGPPGCGKTELLLSFMDIPGVRKVGRMKDEAAFLSGVGKKDRVAGASGGLLREIGRYGCLLWEDFGSILSKPQWDRDIVMGILRDCYQGYFERDLGTDGGKLLKWPDAKDGGRGKLTVLAGSTPAIDRIHSTMADLGERFVYYRYEDDPQWGWAQSNKALSRTSVTADRGEMRQAMADFWESLGMDWEPKPGRQLTGKETERIIAMAQLGAASRSVVVREFGTREIVEVPTAEYPARLSQVFKQLYLGMELIGCEDDERWRLIKKMAFDCAPEVRRRVIRVLDQSRAEADSRGETWHGVGSTEIACEIQMSISATARVLEDLSCHRVTEKESGKWRLSAWALQRV